MFNQVRLWLIRWLAGDMSIMLNMTVAKGIVYARNKVGLVADCDFHARRVDIVGVSNGQIVYEPRV